MSKRQILLTDTVVEVVEAQVASGRYADFSAAIQDAAWHFFVGPPSPFEEYGVRPAEVERSAQKDLERIRRARNTGTLKPWQPGSAVCRRLNARSPG
ncbi:MAG: hypothetical protein HY674_01005 [Chloroflexi bacterium]|nr:hypothetical protein [Chloroflexota bacterium]